jgi:hypothetical protein
MKMRKKSSKLRKNNGLTGWSGLAARTAAMMTASAEVIAVRTQRMANAQLPLSNKDAREMRRMVEEKVEAGAESARAVTLPLASQMFGLMPDMLRVAASPDLSTLAARQARLNRKLQQGAVSLSHTAMMPFFKRARANAKRLRKA